MKLLSRTDLKQIQGGQSSSVSFDCMCTSCKCNECETAWVKEYCDYSDVIADWWAFCHGEATCQYGTYECL